MYITGWDNQPLQAAIIKWWGEETCMALLAMLGLISALLLCSCSSPLPPIVLMCNLGNIPLAQ